MIVEVLEEVTGELERKCFKEGTEKIKANNIKKVFVDVSRVPNTASVHDSYSLAYYETERLDHPKSTKIAVFVSLDDHSHDFTETLFQNAGYHCTIFRDKNSAIEWLRHN